MRSSCSGSVSAARRAEVRAIAPSTLLVLDEARFRRLLDRSAALQDAVRASAEKRGVDPERLFEDTAVPRAAEDRAPA